MHLSNEIQNRLDRLKSNVKLAFTVDGTFPDQYAFYHNSGRNFRVEFGPTDKVLSIVLFKRTEKQNYEVCFARGLFANIDKLVDIIILWVDKQIDIIEIKKRFVELELYEDFEFRNPNIDIDKAWTKVKNMFFNDTEFWKFPEWKERYVEMLIEAKKHKSFEDYFPFTSHYWLRFSIDKANMELWTSSLYIVPTMYSEEVPETLGKFYVSYNAKPMGGQFFGSAKGALDFYAEKLKVNNPIR